MKTHKKKVKEKIVLLRIRNVHSCGGCDLDHEIIILKGEIEKAKVIYFQS